MDVKYNLGDVIYLKTDTEQRQRIVVGLWITEGCIRYEVACGTSISWHYDIEMSKDRDILLSITNN